MPGTRERRIVILVQYSFTGVMQRIFSPDEIQDSSLSSVMYWTFWYVDRSSESSYTRVTNFNNGPFLAHSVYGAYFFFK